MHTLQEKKLQLTRKLLLVLGISLGLSFLNGCTTKVIFVDNKDDVVRLGEDVRGHVYVMQDGKWVKSSRKVTLPAGWYAGYLSKEDIEAKKVLIQDKTFDPNYIKPIQMPVTIPPYYQRDYKKSPYFYPNGSIIVPGITYSIITNFYCN